MAEDELQAPMMLFDGDCGFCRRWIARWRTLTGPHVRYAPYQEVHDRYPQLTRQQCAHAVQLVMPDGAVYSGAHAVLKALALGGRYAILLRLYERVPPLAWLAERCYQLVARHRGFFSKLSP